MYRFSLIEIFSALLKIDRHRKIKLSRCANLWNNWFSASTQAIILTRDRSRTPVTSHPDTPNWFHLAFKVHGTVLPTILPRLLVFGSFGVLVSLLYALDPPFPLENLGELTSNVACNLVLGLLLAFRTNTAYERFWEGRKAWGTLVVSIRNLARQIQTNVKAESPVDRETKQTTLQLLGAFVIATKFHLRREPMPGELATLLSSTALTELQQASNPPLHITLWIGDYLQQSCQRQQIDSNQRFEMNLLLNGLTDGLTNGERILTTPIPIAYSVYLKRLILIYCAFLPFGLVEHLHWLTGLAVVLISYVLLGVEEIGNEIEDPFGTDPNDLSIDDICNTVLDSIEIVQHFQPMPSASPVLDAPPLLAEKP
jgi:putative membrane protein